MNKELKQNDPVMWRKKEYKFVRYYDEGTAIIAEVRKLEVGEALVREIVGVDPNELDLIMEFDFM